MHYMTWQLFLWKGGYCFLGNHFVFGSQTTNTGIPFIKKSHQELCGDKCLGKRGVLNLV